MSHNNENKTVYSSRKHKIIFEVISFLILKIIRNRNFSCKSGKGRNQSDKTQYPDSNSMNTYMFKNKSESKTFIHKFIRKTEGVLVNFQRTINLGHAQSWLFLERQD